MIDSLLIASMLRISADELLKMNKTSIALQDGSGYIGTLETMHALHCLVRDLVFITLSTVSDTDNITEKAISSTLPRVLPQHRREK